MLVLRTSSFQGATIRPIVPRHKHSTVQKSIRIKLNCFPDFETKAVKRNKKKIEKENRLNTILIQFQLFISYKTRLFTEKISRTTTIHPGIFGGRALWADSGLPRMNTIASRDQFKSIRIGEI